MEWKNYTFQYEPMAKEDLKAHRAKVVRALEKSTFTKPIGRFHARRLWFLFRHASWNPFRRRISIPEALHALASAREMEEKSP